MWLLDTNVVSELRKTPTGRADANVARWAQDHSEQLSYLSAITVKELMYGVLLVARRDSDQGRRLHDWVDGVLARFAERVIPVDEAVARQAAQFHVPDPAPEADAYIAATALTHGLCLVTRNSADFARFKGLTLLNPWVDR